MRVRLAIAVGLVLLICISGRADLADCGHSYVDHEFVELKVEEKIVQYNAILRFFGYEGDSVASGDEFRSELNREFYSGRDVGTLSLQFESLSGLDVDLGVFTSAGSDQWITFQFSFKWLDQDGADRGVVEREAVHVFHENLLVKRLSHTSSTFLRE